MNRKKEIKKLEENINKNNPNKNLYFEVLDIIPTVNPILAVDLMVYVISNPVENDIMACIKCNFDRVKNKPLIQEINFEDEFCEKDLGFDGFIDIFNNVKKVIKTDVKYSIDTFSQNSDLNQQNKTIDFAERIVLALIKDNVFYFNFKNELGNYYTVLVDMVDYDEWKEFSLDGNLYVLNIFRTHEDEQNKEKESYQLAIYGVDESRKLDTNNIYLEGYEVPVLQK